MNKVKTLTSKIEQLKTETKNLIAQRNNLIMIRYSELYNINTWHKIKVGYVLKTIAKEYGLADHTVKNIVGLKKKLV